MFMKKDTSTKQVDVFDSVVSDQIAGNKTDSKKRKTYKPSAKLTKFIKKQKKDELTNSPSQIFNEKEQSPAENLSAAEVSPTSAEEMSQTSAEEMSQTSAEEVSQTTAGLDEKDRKAQSQQRSAEAWSKLFNSKAKTLPLCSGHKEQSVVRTVKKSGENMGRQFYCCARPMGAAGDKEARCSYFQWANGA